MALDFVVRVGRPAVITVPNEATTELTSMELSGYIVSETMESLGIDMRYEADIEAIPPHPALWAITHIPTGRRVGTGLLQFRATSMCEAAAKARLFYSEMGAIGVKLEEVTPSTMGTMFSGLTGEQKLALFARVGAAV